MTERMNKEHPWQAEPNRREWRWKKGHPIVVTCPSGTVTLDGGHIREVLTGDPDPAAVAELISEFESVLCRINDAYRVNLDNDNDKVERACLYAQCDLMQSVIRKLKGLTDAKD